MIFDPHNEEGYCIILYPEENWAEIDSPSYAGKYWEGPIDQVEKVLPDIIKRYGTPLAKNPEGIIAALMERAKV
jgi:hypothetical protein